MHKKNKSGIFLILILGFIVVNSMLKLHSTEAKDILFDISISDPKSITVTNPISSSSWEMGSTCTITWTSTGDIPSIYLDLYKDNSNNHPITSLTPNDGSYDWFIPNDLIPGIEYQIVVGDLYEPSLQGFSEYFEITGIPEPESIIITTPNHTTSWQISTVKTITWTSQGLEGYVYIDLYKGNKNVDDIYMWVPDDGSYDWFIPNDLVNGLDYQIKIGNFYDYYLSNFSEHFEIYDIPEPKTITITNPFSLSSWSIGSSRSITWTTTGKINNVGIMLYKDNSFLEVITTSTPDDGSYSWAIPSSLEESNFYKIKIYESSNSTIYDYSESFTIVNGSDVPQLTIHSPTSDSVWNTEHEYSIRWTCDQDPIQYDTVNIRLYKRNDMILTIAEQEQNIDEYSFLIPENLEIGNDYRIYIQLLDTSNMIYQFSTYFTISSVSISDDSNPDNFIPGYSLMILLGIFGVISFKVSKKYYKN